MITMGLVFTGKMHYNQGMFASTAPRSIRHALFLGTRKAIVLIVMFGSGFIGISHIPTAATVVTPEQRAPVVEAPLRSEVLVQKHDCWTGEAPADMEGKIPGHVVITEAGRTFLGGPAKVSIALDVVFAGAESEIETIHGFCR